MTVKLPVCVHCEEPIKEIPHPDDPAKTVWGRMDLSRRTRDGDSLYFCDPGSWALTLHKPFADMRTQPILDSAMCITCGWEFGQGPHTDWAHEPNYYMEGEV